MSAVALAADDRPSRGQMMAWDGGALAAQWIIRGGSLLSEAGAAGSWQIVQL
jgi:hypothetical protein